MEKQERLFILFKLFALVWAIILALFLFSMRSEMGGII